MIQFKGNIRSDVKVAVASLKKEVMAESIKKLRAATPVDTGKARDGWQIDGDSIVNPVDYIDNLNRGSSQQAPAHFIEKTLLSQKGVVPSGTIVRRLTHP